MQGGLGRKVSFPLFPVSKCRDWEDTLREAGAGREQPPDPEAEFRVLQRAPGPESREGADLVFGQENNHPSSLPTQAVVKGGSILFPLGPSQGPPQPILLHFFRLRWRHKGLWKRGMGGGGGGGEGDWAVGGKGRLGLRQNGLNF